MVINGRTGKDGDRRFAEIEHEGKRGRVEYNESTTEFRVEHPDPEIMKTVTGYLSSVREFRIPESNRINDYREEIRRPTESRMHMELALSGGFYQTGAKVLWETKEEIPSSGSSKPENGKT